MSHGFVTKLESVSAATRVTPWLKTILFSRIRLFALCVLPVARSSLSVFLFSVESMVQKGYRLHTGLAREILEALFHPPRRSPQPQRQSRRQSTPGEWRQVRRSQPKKEQKKMPKQSGGQTKPATIPTNSQRGPVSPDDISLPAQEKVSRLEAAIAVLGDHPDPSVLKTLEDALHKVKEGTSVPSVGVRLDSCAQFVERARRRLAKAEEEFNRVQEERVQRATVPGAPQCNPNPPSQDVCHLQEVIRGLQAEVATLRAATVSEGEEESVPKRSRTAAPRIPMAIVNT